MLLLVTVALHLNLAHAGAPQIPQLLQEVEAQYVKAVSLSAEFEQVDHAEAMNRDKKSSGHILVKRPDKFRWETIKPDASLLVTNGKSFWFYTPPFDESEHGQVVIRKTSQVQSRLASALLSGSFSQARDMKIHQNTTSRFTLTPRKGSAGDVTKAFVQIDPQRKLIMNVRIEHADGNHAEITLSDIKLGVAVKDSDFIFTPPPNTDRVTE